MIFLLFFAEFVKSSAFYTLLLLFQRVDMFELQFDAKTIILMSTLWNSSNSFLKAVDLTNSAKNRRKMGLIDLNFQTKKVMDLACRLN